MLIRDAEDGDYAAYCGLVREFDRYFSAKDPGRFRVPVDPVRSLEAFKSFWGGQDKGVLMAFEDGNAVGIGNYNIEPVDYPSLLPKRDFFISIISVRADRRRQGIGRALLNALKARAKERGCDGLVLHVQNFNEDAMAFYNAEGFGVRDHVLEMRLG